MACLWASLPTCTGGYVRLSKQQPGFPVLHKQLQVFPMGMELLHNIVFHSITSSMLAMEMACMSSHQHYFFWNGVGGRRQA